MSDDQITYLEKLLAEYKSRYISGDKSIELQLRATAAKIEKLKAELEQGGSTIRNVVKNVGAQIRRSCCRK